MAPGSPHRDALEIISLLRNSIHDSGLPTFGMASSIHGPTRTTVRTPRGSYAARAFSEAIDSLGGKEAWGVQTAPMTAGLAIQATTNLRSLPIAPWAGLGVLAAWAAASLLIGALLLRFRDA